MPLMRIFKLIAYLILLAGLSGCISMKLNPLTKAAVDGKRTKVAELLAEGADPGDKVGNKYSRNALRWAASRHEKWC